ncbi:phorbol-12-myristate-13-acetate-induced protein 1-like [Lepus europaeus]|uniref:phorbol-12-myristate-13-acetate-induced protein 1-like n=1 Tax=Lepus europaeus TaxID=9983 RepID=UPI002B49C8AE|nr:phorbol-12-myristate-13-acetate-induced protein 1-like [Lepus europaeus]
MPGKRARKRSQSSPQRAPADLEGGCGAQLPGAGLPLPASAEFSAADLAEKSGKKAQNTQPRPARPLSELEVECATQLRIIGDKLDLRRKLLNLISKFFSFIP